MIKEADDNDDGQINFEGLSSTIQLESGSDTLLDRVRKGTHSPLLSFSVLSNCRCR